MNPPSNERYIFIGVLVFAVLFAVVFVVIQKEKTEKMVPQSVPQVPEEPKALSNVDEVILQQQLQEILAKGNEGDCETLGDERYQFACHDFFKIQKK